MFVTFEDQVFTDVTDVMVAALASGAGRAGDLELFAGTTTGVYRSRDIGQTWIDTEAGKGIPSPVLALGVSPHYERDDTVFAGTVDGLWRSTDNAASWRHVLGGGAVNALLLLPTDADAYDLLVGTDKDGVLRSDDAGQSWRSANPGLLDFSVLALEAVRHSDLGQIIIAGTASGLYRSVNDGKSWRLVNLPVDPTAVQSLEACWSQSSVPTILAGTEAEGLFRSNDTGQSWEAVEDLGLAGVTAIASFPVCHDPCGVACTTSEGLAVSRDCGSTWRLVGELAEPALALHVISEDGAFLYLAGMPTKGLAWSHDGGRSWSPVPLSSRQGEDT